MKNFRIDYKINETTEAWSNIQAVSENHACRKLRTLMERFYPESKCDITKCTQTLIPPIREGTQFIFESATYMWDRPIDDNSWDVVNLDDNTAHIATVDEDNNILEMTPQPIQPGVAYGMASVINTLIMDEYEAIEGYNAAIVTAQEEGLMDVVSILTDIQAEEQLHVGQLQKALELFDPNATNVQQGAEEAEEQLETSDDVAVGDIDGFLAAYENYMKEGDTNA